MQNGWAIAGIVLAVVLLVIGGSAASTYNLGNRSETGIHSRYAANENILAQYGQKIAEQVGVTEMARDDMVKLLGESQAPFSMIQEAFPGLDQDAYTTIQQSIEAGRNDFAQAQNQLADAKRVYQTSLDSLWTGTWLSAMGYPRINVNQEE